MTDIAKTSAQRQRQWRENRKALGYQQHTIWIDPDVASALDAAITASRAKQAERQRVINECLRQLMISSAKPD